MECHSTRFLTLIHNILSMPIPYPGFVLIFFLLFRTYNNYSLGLSITFTHRIDKLTRTSPNRGKTPSPPSKTSHTHFHVRLRLHHRTHNTHTPFPTHFQPLTNQSTNLTPHLNKHVRLRASHNHTSATRRQRLCALGRIHMRRLRRGCESEARGADPVQELWTSRAVQAADEPVSFDGLV
jgi:hypothetical protein